MRFFYAFALAGLLSVPLSAQTGPSGYAVFASQDDLADGGTLSGAVPSCIAVVSAPGPTAVVLFFGAVSGVLATYDESAAPGSRTTVVATVAELEASAGAPVTVCRDATAGIEDPRLHGYPAFLAVADADNTDRVLRLDESGALTRLTDPDNATDAGDGVSGLATFEGLGLVVPGLYLARVAAFGAPEDGIYRLDLDGADQTPTAVVADPDIDLVGLASDDRTNLLAVSSEFGEGDRANVVLAADLRDDPVTLDLWAQPCEGSDPTFTDCTDGGLEAVEAFYFGAKIQGSFPLVFNNSFSGADGETATALDFGESLFTESGLVSATGIGGYTPAGSNGYLVIAYPADQTVAPRILLAGSDAFGGTPGIFAVDAPVAVAGESGPEGIALGLTVGPNPVRSDARIALTLATPSAVRVTLVDALGRTVQTLHRGDATRELSLRLDTSGLADGVYHVVAVSGAGRTSAALTVAR